MANPFRDLLRPPFVWSMLRKAASRKLTTQRNQGARRDLRSIDTQTKSLGM
jgi:hypothetical protein